MLPGVNIPIEMTRTPLASGGIVAAACTLGVLGLLVMDRVSHRYADTAGAPGERVRTWLFVAAIVMHNVPEGLSSAAGMKRAGRSARYVFGVWGGIALASGIAALVGCLTLQDASAATVAFITAVAAGAILAMLADTMIPEAFERTHLYAGLIACVGFLLAFSIERA